jgi:hypothetical protein
MAEFYWRFDAVFCDHGAAHYRRTGTQVFYKDAGSGCQLVHVHLEACSSAEGARILKLASTLKRHSD